MAPNSSPPEDDGLVPVAAVPQGGLNVQATLVRDQPQDQPPKQPTITEALQTLKWSDGKVLFRTPCTREAFIYGFLSGGVVGTTGYLFKRPLMTCCNMAVGSFLIVTVASWEYCRRLYTERYEAVARGIVLQLEQKRRQAERERQTKPDDSSDKQ